MIELSIIVLIGMAVGYVGYRNATMRQRAMREAAWPKRAILKARSD